VLSAWIPSTVTDALVRAESTVTGGWAELPFESSEIAKLTVHAAWLRSALWPDGKIEPIEFVGPVAPEDWAPDRLVDHLLAEIDQLHQLSGDDLVKRTRERELPIFVSFNKDIPSIKGHIEAARLGPEAPDPLDGFAFLFLAGDGAGDEVKRQFTIVPSQVFETELEDLMNLGLKFLSLQR
jgi:hypothetical protein